MELNELKNLCKSVKAPTAPAAATLSSTERQSGLLERLKAEEAKEARQLRKARPLWLFAATCFFLVFLGMVCLPPAGLRPARLWLGGVLAAVYIVNAVLLSRRLRQLTRIDYTASLRTFLDEAEQRYRFMRPREYCLSGVGLILLGVVSGAYFEDALVRRHLAPERQMLGMGLYYLGYLLVCAAGFTFTYRNWSRERAPLLADIVKMKAELKAEEAVETESERSDTGSVPQSSDP